MTTNPNPRKRPAPGSIPLPNNEFQNMSSSVHNNGNTNMLNNNPGYHEGMPVQIQQHQTVAQNDDLQLGQLVLSQPPYNSNSGNPSGEIVKWNTPHEPIPAEELESLKEAARKIAQNKNGRRQIPPFVQKLAKFVNDPNCDDVIRWSDTGTTFLVLDEDAFSKNLIPDLFKHNNYASFVRQLNMYGFHKIVALSDGSMKTAEQRAKPILEYYNRYFLRDQPDLLWLIHKPKNATKKKSQGKKGKPSIGKADSDDDGASSDEGMTDNIDTGNVDHRGQTRLIDDGQQNRIPPNQPSIASNNVPRTADLSNVMQQLEAIRNHQALISSAISRLRNDHNALYQQATAFQTMHDRHEHSINNILGFLATVYDKSLAGHLNPSYNNMFNPLDVNQAVIPGQPGPTVAPSVATPRRIKKRAPLLLENGPSFETADDLEMPGIDDYVRRDEIDLNGSNPNLKYDFGSLQPSPNTFQTQNYHSPSIQEILSPSNTAATPQIESPIMNFARNNSRSGQSVESKTPSMAVTPRLELRSPSPGNTQAALQNHKDKLNETGISLDDLEKFQKDQDANINSLSRIMKDVIADSYPENGNKGNHMSNVNTMSNINNNHLTPSGNFMPSTFDTDFSSAGNIMNPDGTFNDFLQPDLFTDNNDLDFTNFDTNAYINNNGVYSDGLISLNDYSNLGDGRIMSAHGSSSEAGTPDSRIGPNQDVTTEEGHNSKKRKINF